MTDTEAFSLIRDWQSDGPPDRNGRSIRKASILLYSDSVTVVLYDEFSQARSNRDTLLKAVNAALMEWEKG